MIDVLNSVLIKHDTSFKSLTKRALAQIILKVIYEKQSNGISTKSICARIEQYIDVLFSIPDLEDAIIHLRNDKKIISKENRHFLKPEIKEIIDKSVRESEIIQNNVIHKWFGKSETYLSENGNEIINKWFNKLLIHFFKEYRYDWINDLKLKNVKKKRSSFNLEKILESCFENFKINPSDKDWLKNQFVKFIESEEREDNDLLWLYGTSMFSATLLTAKSYADDFTIDMFKESYFILDTNILMTLGLEGHELHLSYKPIEEVFEKLKIKPIYFYISKEEYKRAILKKKQAVLASLDEFGIDIIKETECGIIKTALKRHCRTKQDFEQFFLEIEEVPSTFCENLNIELIDFLELHNAIEKGQYDEETQNRINAINFGRRNSYKSKNVLTHDAGLVQGALFLNQKRKSWILTKDGTVRAYANETAFRNDDPIAIGLDSFIQMMVINNGCIEHSTCDFSPLFAKIIQFSLLPEKDFFKVEDLYFILETATDIQSLRKENILEIAKNVNRLRIQNKSDDDITLEIRRYFQKTKVDYEAEKVALESEKFELVQKERRTLVQKENLELSLHKTILNKKYNSLNISIRNNWLYSIILTSIVIFIIHFVINNYMSENQTTILLISISVQFIVSLFFVRWKGVKFYISRKDKQRIEEETNAEIAEIKFKDKTDN
jgi:hypothetical protein